MKFRVRYEGHVETRTNYVADVEIEAADQAEALKLAASETKNWREDISSDDNYHTDLIVDSQEVSETFEAETADV